MVFISTRRKIKRIGGIEKSTILLGADCIEVFDSGIVDARKWIEASLEWDGTWWN